jgi:hypothetical protein
MAQVLTEPGIEAALDAEWDSKLVFVDGMDAIVEHIELYRSNRTLRARRLAAATAHAKAHYATELFLRHFFKEES